ncbi:hypothetical protein FC62_GL001146 [Amylolactobacillus amylotrophicus DSM 20534]|uniref:Uncharacterized protein n=5 Tax=Amylolactobacillus TaxID=2767876 RepID=A0A1L6XCB9_9LACO|nr:MULTISPECIES: ABC transporter permease [Amylolactobacillus]APT18628.1 hypothetical protein LA20533_04835 [Amylolactobacillus amylophilus DSM 20533 = JCM 1125]KRK37811.1 hypothetical protein FC62_GL001146 [Amylolactobacillus amylotrophicus DSM 20534]KRM41599.1 hypothetical protein FD40_GL001441 [Amylolactobacillus amylophilus DSM 20533 = JCM 1125]GED80993.1 cell division protein FtsX [Amylolactobacillus amylophilus]
MKTTWKLSLRLLKTDIKRTIMTIIAMAIAATLAVAVLVGLRSGQRTMFDIQTKDSGGYVMQFNNVPVSGQKEILNNSAFKLTAISQTKGTFEVDDSNYYVNIDFKTMPRKSLYDLAKPILTSGRLPNAKNEVLVPDGYDDIVDGKVTFTIAGKKQTFNVVGRMMNFTGSLVNTGSILGYSDDFSGPINIAVIPKRYTNFYAEMDKIAAKAKVKKKDLQFLNSALQTMGQSRGIGAAAVTTTVVLVILAIIGVVALILIYTSINLSVMAQRKRYGLLRSIGTTPRQIRQIVYQQALILVVPSMVLGYGFGVVGMSGVIKLINQILAKGDAGLVIKTVIDWPPLLVALFFMVLMAIIASFRPARRAAKVTPINAIKQLDPSPKLTKRHLKNTWLIRHVKQPTARLAMRNYRRSAQKRTMMATLIFTLMLFVGLTAFVSSFIQEINYRESADIVFWDRDKKTDEAELQSVFREADKLKNYQSGSFMHAIAEYPKTYTKSGEAVDEKRDGDIYVLGINQQDFQNDFNGKPTLISIQMTYDLGGGRSEVISDFPVQDNFVLKLADWSQNGANKTKYSYTLTSRVVVDTYNVATKMISNFNLDNTLVVSQQQFKEIAAKVGKGSDDVGIAAAAKLANSKNHQRVNDALRAQFPNAYTTDNIAEQNKQRSLMLGVRILIYGFIALLSLVSLATIVSHIFSTLLTSKRSLAMFQSVGMTAKQVTGMLGIQNAILLITGGVIGTGLGVGVSYGLFKMMNDYYLNHYLFPTTQIIVVGLMLLVVWAVFQIFIYRTVKAQDINELIRAE